jgi:hypothetical protein
MKAADPEPSRLMSELKVRRTAAASTPEGAERVEMTPGPYAPVGQVGDQPQAGKPPLVRLRMITITIRRPARDPEPELGSVPFNQ